MDEKDRTTELGELVRIAMECLAVGVTVIDTKGTILYYNEQAAEILDRKPEYIGKDANSHHKKAATKKRFASMLQEFEEGRSEPFRYKAKPYGNVIVVTLAPIIRDGQYVGSVQSVWPEEVSLSEK